MIGVRKGASNDLPSRIPLYFLFVDENSHEFGNGECGMSLHSPSAASKAKIRARVQGGFTYIIQLDGDIYITRSIIETRSLKQCKKCEHQRTLRELSKRLSEILESPHDITQTGSCPEILLLQTKLLPNFDQWTPDQKSRQGISET
jgi:hypothetical protein